MENSSPLHQQRLSCWELPAKGKSTAPNFMSQTRYYCAEPAHKSPQLSKWTTAPLEMGRSGLSAALCSNSTSTWYMAVSLSTARSGVHLYTQQCLNTRNYAIRSFARSKQKGRAGACPAFLFAPGKEEKIKL